MQKGLGTKLSAWSLSMLANNCDEVAHSKLAFIQGSLVLLRHEFRRVVLQELHFSDQLLQQGHIAVLVQIHLQCHFPLHQLARFGKSKTFQRRETWDHILILSAGRMLEAAEPRPHNPDPVSWNLEEGVWNGHGWI